MTAYYNENDPFAAQWLRNLIAAGEIPDGEVDVRSIVDVRAADLAPFTECHFFAGIGGWPFALGLAGWTGPVWTGSCPCQPFSSAGKQNGAADERHLWPFWLRLIRECRPDALIGEQVEGAVGFGWLDRVFADLEAEGYACGAAVLGAHSVNAPHIRQRLFWVADGARAGWTERLRNLRGGAERGDTALIEQFAGCGGTVRGLADTDGGQSRHGGLQPGGQHGQQPQDGRAGQRLADPAVRQQHEERQGATPVCRGRPEFPAGLGAGGATGGLADAEHAIGRAQHLAGKDVLDRRDAGRQEAHRLPGACGEVFWADAIWLPCLDGKARRVEPGIFPLVAGLPAAMDGLGPISRVGALRGAGNAIVPQAAAAFVKAFMAAR